MVNRTVLLAPIERGQIVDGKYRVERVLGRGGMGIVVEATHLKLEERFAIKFLLPEILGNSEAVTRFTREACAAIKIKSEHVARTFDVGTLGSGIPYIVMEYLDGTELGEIVEGQGPMPVERAVDLILQACEAVAEAHSLGIVHRDIKPSNLFVVRKADGSESLKVLDFGISKSLNLSASGPGAEITKTSAVLGSPMYMPPEQMDSPRNVDVRTDIWALGATLYQLLTGDPPFAADTIPELCTKVLKYPTPALRERRPDAPAGVEAVIFHCMEKEPEHRYPSVSRLASELAGFGSRKAQDAAERVSLILRHVDPPPNTVASPRTSFQPSPSRQSSPPLEPGVVPQRFTDPGGTHGSWEHSRPPAAAQMRIPNWLGAVIVGLAGLVGGLGMWLLWPKGSDGAAAAASAPPQELSATVASKPSAQPVATPVVAAVPTPTNSASAAPADDGSSAPTTQDDARTASPAGRTVLPSSDKSAALPDSRHVEPSRSSTAQTTGGARRGKKGDMFADRY